MTPLESALVEVTGFLDDLRVPHMLIGGLAVALWGEPRTTLDVDLSLWIEPDQFETTFARFLDRFGKRAPEEIAAARASRVLRIQASSGAAVDLLFAAWPMEREAIENAVTRRIGNREVRVVSIEYLLFLKLISERPKDLADAQALLRRHRGKFDRQWLERELTALAESTAQPEILSRFQHFCRSD